MKFKHILGECDSKEWASERQVDDEGRAYWLIISLLNLAQITGDEIYTISIGVVVPEVAGDEWRDLYGGIIPTDEQEIAGTIWEYGLKAYVWDTQGENPMALMVEAVKQAADVVAYFQTYMEAPLNAIGWNGWTFATGR